ncbi:hypothetical protein K438DRAFT_1988071 [Mycena galopus ATCC 62051]|nr:hypothetical protein K438DRAFT_1988071 [Mycena galopus ATCC 62051]
MKLKEIHRTSTFAWSPSAELPLLATGTVAGALDESFSDESQLEIWAPDFLDRDEYELGGPAQKGPKGVVKDTARFNRLAWGSVDSARSRGVIAAGLENGELALWDPAKILAAADECRTYHAQFHPYRPYPRPRLQPIQTNLIASGAVSGEVYIWDLNSPAKPYTPTPGARSTKLDEMTSVAWNRQVQYVLAGASNTGYTVVWDLRGKREVVALAYGGGGSSGGGMSDIKWHPDNATRLVTASEDDQSPIIMLWDLRNARAPEKILTGHEKGILSLSWCAQDADLLLSCGKDNRTLCWNPQTGDALGELPRAQNWAFQVDWCPRNPDLLAAAFFDGTIGLHSLQGTNESAATAIRGGRARRVRATGMLSLAHPPKWFRRPVAASFGFGGKLVSVSNLPSAAGKHQSGSVHLRSIHIEEQVVERATSLRGALDKDAVSAEGAVAAWASEQFKEGDAENGWKALLSLFKSDSREELVALLGFEKAEIERKVREAVEALALTTDGDATMKEEELEPTRAKVSAATSVSVSVTSQTATTASESESTTTAPSLFGDENAAGADGGDGTDAGDFFSTVVPTRTTSSTLGGEPMLASARYADAILLAVRGGPALLRRTQDAYFASTLTQQGGNGGSGRVLQAVVNADLGDVVRNADVKEWKEVFVVLCTFAGKEKGEFEGLVEELGGRLESQGRRVVEEGEERVWRKNATLAYLAAGKLDRLVGIWGEEMTEDEAKALETGAGSGASVYSARARALQTFIEKVTVFRAATGYVDADLTASEETTYKLSGLYERYYEYASLLAAQGLVDEAVRFLELTPAASKAAAPPPAPLPAVQARQTAAATTRGGYSYQAPVQPAQAQPQYPQQQSGLYGAPSGGYQPPAPSGPYTQPAQGGGNYNAPSQPSTFNPPLRPMLDEEVTRHTLPFSRFSRLARPAAASPAAADGAAASSRCSLQGPPPPAPPPKRQEKGGWNDAPALINASRATPVSSLKPGAITAPFPNSMPASPGFGAPPLSPYLAKASHSTSRRHRVLGASRAARPRPAHAAAAAGQAAVRCAAAAVADDVPAPGRAAGSFGRRPRADADSESVWAAAESWCACAWSRGARQQPGQYAPPPQQQQPGQYAPPPQQQQPGQYAPPPQQQQQPGQYAPPPGSQQQRPGPPGMGGAPPPPGGPPGPAPGSVAAARALPKGPPPPKYRAPRRPKPHPRRVAAHIRADGGQLAQMRQTAPPQQKRLVDDLERRINPLFDALNCERCRRVWWSIACSYWSHGTARSPSSAGDPCGSADAGSQTDDIGLWMSA